jgi:hypothetical protein
MFRMGSIVVALEHVLGWCRTNNLFYMSDFQLLSPRILHFPFIMFTALLSIVCIHAALLEI